MFKTGKWNENFMQTFTCSHMQGCVLVCVHLKDETLSSYLLFTAKVDVDNGSLKQNGLNTIVPLNAQQ